MLRLLKSLLLLLSVITRSFLKKRKSSSLIISIMGLIILILIVPYFTGEKSTKTVYPLSDETFNTIEDSALNIKFRGFPSVSPDGRYIAYNNIILEGRDIKDIDICLYDTKENRSIDLPGLNSQAWDTAPSLSDNGNFIAFQSNKTGKHFWHIYLYDVKSQKLLDLPGLNSFMPDINPSISGDGNIITFASVRSARLNLYIYDRKTSKVSPVPEQ